MRVPKSIIGVFLFFGGVIGIYTVVAVTNSAVSVFPPAINYAPNFWFESEEKYFPVSPFFYTQKPEELSGVKSFDEYTKLSPEEKRRLFTVFYHISDNGDEWIYEYWLYYSFNNFKNEHYHDWEYVFVFVDKETRLVDKAIGSSHNGGFLNSEINHPSINHVWTYVEMGSHANSINQDPYQDPQITHIGNWKNWGWNYQDRVGGSKFLYSDYRLESLDEFWLAKMNYNDFPDSPMLGAFPFEVPFSKNSQKIYLIPNAGGQIKDHAWHKPEYHDPEKASPITVTKVVKAMSEKINAGVNTAKKLAEITINKVKEPVVTAYQNIKNTAQLVFDRMGDSMRTAFDEAKRAFGGRRDAARSLQAGLPFALEAVNSTAPKPPVVIEASRGPRSSNGQNNQVSILQPILPISPIAPQNIQATDTDAIDLKIGTGFAAADQETGIGGIEEESVFIPDPELHFDSAGLATDSEPISESSELDPFIRIGPDNASFLESFSEVNPEESSEGLPEEPTEPEESGDIVPPASEDVPEPTPEPVGVDSRAVVINEIAWMGTEATGQDQWIELYNTSNKAIFLDGWKISWDWIIAFGMSETIDVWLSGTIPAHGYYLMERCIQRFEELRGSCDYAVSNISADLIFNSDMPRVPSRPVYMRLWNQSGEAVDWADMWYAGSDIFGSIETMERVSPYVWNHNANWLSASEEGRNGLDANGNPITGTPKAQNSVYGRYTLISGSYSEDITLYRDRSPYLIYDDSLTIEAGATLTIEPGVVVRVHSTFGDTGIVVYGTIKALGTEAEPIVFTSDLDLDYGGRGGVVPGVWKGIRISSESSDSLFDHTIIRYAGYYPPGFENSSIALLVQNIPIQFRNSVIEYSRTKGLWLSNSASVIEYSLFQNNVFGVFSDNTGDIQATIRNSIFRNNSVHLWVQDGLIPIQEGNIFE